MPILCNCCNTDNAPMARHRGYLICDDCVEKYGSYDAAAFICLARNAVGLDQVPEELLDEIEQGEVRGLSFAFEPLQQEGK